MTLQQKVSLRHYPFGFSVNALLSKAKKTQTHSCLGSDFDDIFINSEAGKASSFGKKNLLWFLHVF